MKTVSIVLVSLLCLFGSSCSKHSAPAANRETEAKPQATAKQKTPRALTEQEQEEAENELQPDNEQIGEDCIGFVSATRAIPPNHDSAPCPQCPADTSANEVLNPENLHIDQVSPEGPTCEVIATITASFRPSTGGAITGGLIGWMSPEQKEQYAQGKTPPGQQTYKVRITYRREGDEWRAVEFERAGP